MINEQEYIISEYQKNFAGLQGHNLAIYGIGKNTQIILEKFNTDNIIGLMDETRTGDTIYGKRVISMDEAAVLGVDTIIIVARASNILIIYQRIADACQKNSITVYDINGRLVQSVAVDKKSFDGYADMSRATLQQKIDCADVVSFDIFDTLVMRRTLYPSDIFKFVEKRTSVGFAKRRIKAETDLYCEGRQPNIYDIYAHLQDVEPCLEIDLESEYLVRREDMCEMLLYAVNCGKRVYLVSDMNLPGYIINSLLDKLEISVCSENILVSCDYGVSKSSGLFAELRKKVGMAKILHIGDNWEADIQSAARYGIDDTFYIMRSEH
jgi:FMN phosphatase YigB (HAD superfamily)